MPIPEKIIIGIHNREQLRQKLAATGVCLNPMAEELFDDPRFSVENEPRLIHPICLSVAELGFTSSVPFDLIMQTAAQRKLLPCPLEVGPILRLAWTDQPISNTIPMKGKAPPGSVTIASEPPPDHEDIPWGFYLRRTEETRWLRGYRSWSGHLWSPEDEIVFITTEGTAASIGLAHARADIEETFQSQS